MENFLGVIIIIGAVIYKIYSNYKKEMESAQKRTPHQRHETPTQAFPIPDLKKEQYIPVIESNLTNNQISDEVKKVLDYKKSITEANKLAKREKKKSEINDLNVEFDLRKAVIQSIILERPYK